MQTVFYLFSLLLLLFAIELRRFDSLDVVATAELVAVACALTAAPKMLATPAIGMEFVDDPPLILRLL